MGISFSDKLTTSCAARSNIVLVLAPHPARLPLPIQRYDEPFLPFGKAIIRATHDLVCGYMFDLAAYLAVGAVGAVALERTIAYVGRELLTILHGPFAGAGFAQLLDESAFGVDAVTLAQRHDLPAYMGRADRSAFVVERGNQEEIAVPMHFGVYWQDERLLVAQTPNRVLSLRVIGEDALYGERGEDFASRIRAGLETQLG